MRLISDSESMITERCNEIKVYSPVKTLPVMGGGNVRNIQKAVQKGLEDSNFLKRNSC